MPDRPSPSYLLVFHGPGPNWDPARDRRAQAKWDEHAAFMDRLLAEKFIRLGGPIDATHAVLLVAAEDERAVEARLAPDPWKSMGILRIERIVRWEILLDSRDRP